MGLHVPWKDCGLPPQSASAHDNPWMSRERVSVPEQMIRQAIVVRYPGKLSSESNTQGYTNSAVLGFF